ncbi:hypothetical protein BJ992_004165 [Sphaerisporangium rubeum]|uniref:Uncharacterized protein n=1 Tax=Sphaerisporangium rubeum TaxID=321317 RepID=A0A7X0IGD1_9ACTN|nr:hypothetical protein [Sphaerisporangium rubeum]
MNVDVESPMSIHSLWPGGTGPFVRVVAQVQEM